MKCIVEGCDNVKVSKDGYCHKHYKQIQRSGRLTPEKEYGRFTFCTVEGCNNKHAAKGYCKTHHKQIERHREITTGRKRRYDKCTVDGCNAEHAAKGLCMKHYLQQRYIQQKNNKANE